MEKIIYAATPFRMENLKEKICDFIQEQGHLPLHPFNTLPMSRYNYENFSREIIMKVCYEMVKISNELWIFGIGTGAFDEYLKAGEIIIPRKSFVKQFDPDWKEHSQKEKYSIGKYKGILNKILPP